jgi:hypothetical protein
MNEMNEPTDEKINGTVRRDVLWPGVLRRLFGAPGAAPASAILARTERCAAQVWRQVGRQVQTRLRVDLEACPSPEAFAAGVQGVAQLDTIELLDLRGRHAGAMLAALEPSTKVKALVYNVNCLIRCEPGWMMRFVRGAVRAFPALESLDFPLENVEATRVEKLITFNWSPAFAALADGLAGTLRVLHVRGHVGDIRQPPHGRMPPELARLRELRELIFENVAVFCDLSSLPHLRSVMTDADVRAAQSPGRLGGPSLRHVAVRSSTAWPTSVEQFGKPAAWPASAALYEMVGAAPVAWLAALADCGEPIPEERRPPAAPAGSQEFGDIPNRIMYDEHGTAMLEGASEGLDGPDVAFFPHKLRLSTRAAHMLVGVPRIFNADMMVPIEAGLHLPDLLELRAAMRYITQGPCVTVEALLALLTGDQVPALRRVRGALVIDLRRAPHETERMVEALLERGIQLNGIDASFHLVVVGALPATLPQQAAIARALARLGAAARWSSLVVDLTMMRLKSPTSLFEERTLKSDMLGALLGALHGHVPLLDLVLVGDHLNVAWPERVHVIYGLWK